MNDWTVVIPWIGPRELLAGCLLSLNLEAAKSWADVHVLVVDNSPDSSADPMGLPVEVVRHPENLGVAGSWNRGLALGARWTLLLSAAMRVDLVALLAVPGRLTDPWGGRTNFAWHAHIVGRACVETVGVFDDGFWPCEYEDTDYMRRMQLAGHPYETLPSLGDLGGAWCVGDSIAGSLGLVPKSDKPAERYLAKWGGYRPDERHEVPFGGALAR